MTEQPLTPEEIEAIMNNINVVFLSNEVRDLEETILGEISDQLLEEFTVAFGGLTDQTRNLNEKRIESETSLFSRSMQ